MRAHLGAHACAFSGYGYSSSSQGISSSSPKSSSLLHTVFLGAIPTDQDFLAVVGNLPSRAVQAMFADVAVGSSVLVLMDLNGLVAVTHCQLPCLRTLVR